MKEICYIDYSNFLSGKITKKEIISASARVKGLPILLLGPRISDLSAINSDIREDVLKVRSIIKRLEGFESLSHTQKTRVTKQIEARITRILNIKLRSIGFYAIAERNGYRLSSHKSTPVECIPRSDIEKAGQAVQRGIQEIENTIANLTSFEQLPTIKYKVPSKSQPRAQTQDAQPPQPEKPVKSVFTPTPSKPIPDEELIEKPSRRTVKAGRVAQAKTTKPIRASAATNRGRTHEAKRSKSHTHNTNAKRSKKSKE